MRIFQNTPFSEARTSRISKETLKTTYSENVSPRFSIFARNGRMTPKKTRKITLDEPDEYLIVVRSRRVILDTDKRKSTKKREDKVRET